MELLKQEMDVSLREEHVRQEQFRCRSRTPTGTLCFYRKCQCVFYMYTCSCYPLADVDLRPPYAADYRKMVPVSVSPSSGQQSLCVGVPCDGYGLLAFCIIIISLSSCWKSSRIKVEVSVPVWQVLLPCLQCRPLDVYQFPRWKYRQPSIEPMYALLADLYLCHEQRT